MKWKNKEECPKHPSDPLYIFCISDGSIASRKQIYWKLQYDIALCEEMIEARRGNCCDWEVIAPRLTRRLKPPKYFTGRGCRDRFGIIRRKHRNTWKRWVPMLYRLVSRQWKGFIGCTFHTRYSRIHNAWLSPILSKLVTKFQPAYSRISVFSGVTVSYLRIL